MNLNFKSRKRIILWLCLALVLIAILLVVWHRYFGATRIAFVNYQVTTLGQISKANDNSFIKIRELGADDFDRLADYDMVLVNGMGLRITADQRQQLIKAAEEGTPVLTTAATNPENRIVSVDSIQEKTIKEYLAGAGRRNYRNMLRYIRRDIDRKKIATGDPEAAVQAPDEMLYHPDMADSSAEDVGFNSVNEYNAYLKRFDLLKPDAPAVVICGAMGDPTELIKALERTGNNIYAVRDFNSFMAKGHIDSVAPSAVINMAHGRMGDHVVAYLRRANIPLFSPLNVNRPVEEWQNDKMGMSGGFMSQSIVTPEIDGAIRPFTLFGNYVNDEGLQELRAIPERLDAFVATVNNYLSLRHKPNSEKRLAIFYFKGPGQNALTASGMEVIPSLYNMLVKLRSEGYDVTGLPSSAKELGELIQRRGSVFGTYAEGDIADFMRSGDPLLISADRYAEWIEKSITPERYQEVVNIYGEFPGDFMSTPDGQLGVARIELGNVVLLPQPAAGGGSDSFRMVHGTDAAPPHPYIAAYLWAREGFGADAIIHFGTHGSLEYTPRRQVALGSDDWPDRLIGNLPHIYVYTIGNVGEALIAKRRSYAGLQSYLTPPFMESSVRGIYRNLTEAIKTYDNLLGAGASEAQLLKAAGDVRRHTEQLGIHRELGLDSLIKDPYTEADIARIEQFSEELANEKITGRPYILGEPYEPSSIESSVYSMAVDPIAYSVYALDRLNGKASPDVDKHKSLFSSRYIEPARRLVGCLLADPSLADDRTVCSIAGITPDELALAREIDNSRKAPRGMMAMMMAMSGNARSGMPVDAGKPSGMPAMNGAEMPPAEYSRDDVNKAMAILKVEQAVLNVGNYKRLLSQSPRIELSSIVNALNGGFTAPSPGGDPIVNPNTLPTGRNLYGINAEATPGESAWEQGKMLAENTIKMYRRRHNDSVPRKVSYTLWSGEFIETEGATIAQVLYMLGVEPIRDAFGRVTDLRLIPSSELGRPRIDVVVQTSGQLRDLAASRLFLINRAVEMAAAAGDDEYVNQVSEGALEAERRLVEKGLSPKEAREISTFRVFGGVNGSYGTGIQQMVQAGDKWEDEKEIADVYLGNMGAFYGREDQWESVRQYAFEAALANTDAVIQPRQSNTWGPLSLDHVYEFMGGLNLAVRNVTGKDPDAYLSDYRNHNNMRMQEVKEAIGVESRTTIFNPAYIKEKMKGDAGAAGEFAEIVQNTYGWNVMKPQAIDNEMWNDIYDVYVDDRFELGVKGFFEDKNPAALQDISAVMMESARKGMWKASDEQLARLAELHAYLVGKYGASGSSNVLDNVPLREFMASKMNPATAQVYHDNISKARYAASADNGMVMSRHTEDLASQSHSQTVSSIVIVAIVIVALIIMIVIVRRRRKNINS